MKLNLIKWLFFTAIFFTAVPMASYAQSNDSDWFADDEDDEEGDPNETTDSVTVLTGSGDVEWDNLGEGNFDDVKIRLNGEAFEIQDEMAFNKKETLTVSVRHLKRGTGVTVIVYKAGVSLGSKTFYANEKGQLDLEIQTGNKKVKGTAHVEYTPSNGVKVKRDVSIMVE